MRNTLVAIIGAIMGCVLGLLLYAALTATGHPPLDANDVTERGRQFTPVLFAVYGAIIGSVVACIGLVWRSRRSLPNDRNVMHR